MSKVLFTMALTLSSMQLFAAPAAVQSVIDFSKFQASVKTYGSMEKESWNLGYYAFNYAPELIPYFAILKKNHNIDAAVETGTFLGGTTLVFSLLFDEVHTIEIMPATYQSASQRLKKFSNVRCHLGSSENVLSKLLPSLEGKRVLFYLDAHWQNHWPLLEELEAISRTHRDRCIIVIDDFKVPDRPEIPYDAYQNNECSYEYIREHLDLVFSDYTYHYLIPKSVDSRAKFVAIPKNWKG